jgi:hypothetical protein
VIQLVPGSGTGVDVGDLVINASGAITFTPDSFEAIPEPSITALVLLGAVGMAVFHLRRRTAKV